MVYEKDTRFTIGTSFVDSVEVSFVTKFFMTNFTPSLVLCHHGEVNEIAFSEKLISSVNRIQKKNEPHWGSDRLKLNLYLKINVVELFCTFKGIVFYAEVWNHGVTLFCSMKIIPLLSELLDFLRRSSLFQTLNLRCEKWETWNFPQYLMYRELAQQVDFSQDTVEQIFQSRSVLEDFLHHRGLTCYLYNGADQWYPLDKKLRDEINATLNEPDSQCYVPPESYRYAVIVKGLAAYEQCDRNGAKVNEKLFDKPVLYWALQNHESVEVIEFLLQKGADIYESDSSLSTPTTPVQAALYSGYPFSLIRYLVDKGVKIDGTGPVHAAIRSKYSLEEIDWLVQQGGCYQTLRDPDFVKKLYCFTMLYSAIEKQYPLEFVRFLMVKADNPELVQEVLQKSLLEVLRNEYDMAFITEILETGVDVNTDLYYGESLLHYAVQHPQRNRLVPYLISKGANVNLSSYAESTPLHFAMGLPNNTECISFLVNHGADVNATDYRGNTPLHYAVRHDNKQDSIFNAGITYEDSIENIACLLEHGALVNSKNEYGETPLSIAIKHKTKKVIHFLLEQGADVHSPGFEGEPPFHLAVLFLDDPEIIQLFLEKGADPNGRNNAGETPLHHAVLHDNISMFSLLLEYGADNNVKDSLGNTPVAFAVRTCHLATIEYLFQKDADIYTENTAGETLLHQAALYANDDEVIHFLLRNGLDVNAKDNSGATPLHRAVCHRASIIKILMDHGADLHICDIKGRTPFHFAARHQNAETLAYLIDHGADGTLPDHFGLTPLHWSVANSDSTATAFLLQKGVDPNAKDCKNRTPADLTEDVDILELIRKYE